MLDNYKNITFIMNNFRKILIALIPFKNTGKQKTYNRKKADQNQ